MEGRGPQEQNEELTAKKKEFRSGKNILRIWLETFLKSLINQPKNFNSKLDTKLG